ncbi:LysM peptidoglycan-binding domain-containing M23 family metallopeptidase [Cognatishimia activa]|uniref:LysM peptidoglycan-binding domain-containing M23 family metallopeptidase n=1 Tax=Cognatishimia activa TaxID=1715691 RepID=UPI00222E90B2|nr:LysM peptidoglycan-binding domain-containing M23 family metallopeptidase [Cognatishimia activa]UZD92291.1 LysM peptidoglycan-binding domain-containing M23 family metallopeptidase [Cognatishimia activa]
MTVSLKRPAWNVTARLVMAVSAMAMVSACSGPLDLDLRDVFGQRLDTSEAAVGATAQRPEPDNRGIISYPNYQVAVARRGDTVSDVANRVGVDANQLAEYNAVNVDDPLRAGEIVALPTRVSEPTSGQIVSPSNVDISSLAGNAIDNATPTAVETDQLEAAPVQITEDTQIGYEPIRHTVQRGETAFTIARLYNVSVRALAEWNGLGSDFTIRENQILLIPPAQPSAPSESARPQARSTETSAPGQGSATPVPPSAAKPLPDEKPSAQVAKPAAQDLSKTQTKPANSSAKMSFPVNGKIIRTYAKGKNNGIDLSAPAGTPVVAAADGTVAAITTDADGVKIVVVRHPDNIMTVYYNVDSISVAKGASVKRNAKLAQIPSKDSFVHFEVRKGFDSIDPMPYLQ